MAESILQSLCVWGCLTYILNPKLQDGKKIPKWDACARRGQYMGVSPYHSSHLGLILNQHTGKISPQYHVVYNELFVIRSKKFDFYYCVQVSVMMKMMDSTVSQLWLFELFVITLLYS